MQSVYVIEAEDGLLKIGISKNPRQRLSDLQTGSPRPLRLVHVQECNGVAQIVEQRAHVQLAKYRKEGEWFEIDRAVAIDAIEQIAATYCEDVADQKSNVDRIKITCPRCARHRTLYLTIAERSKLFRCRGCNTRFTL